MSLHNRVLAELEAARGTYLSGAALAQSLGVSRNAVWKTIQSLEEAGHRIDALPRRGYRLAVDSDLLSASHIRAALHTEGLSIEVYPTLDSTNAWMRTRAEAGAPEGLLVVSEAQTAGRGRRGRSFYSPAEGGIYMTLLLRPQLAAKEALCITTCAAVAVCRALSAVCGVEAGINCKKVCGIGTEASFDLENDLLRYVALGIGLNLYPGSEAPPEELRGIYGTVLPHRPDKALRCRLIAAIVDAFFDEYDALPSQSVWEAYRARLLVLNKDVFLTQGQQSEPVHVLDLAPDFSLLVRLPSGEESLVSSGEVSLRFSDI